MAADSPSEKRGQTAGGLFDGPFPVTGVIGTELEVATAQDRRVSGEAAEHRGSPLFLLKEQVAELGVTLTEFANKAVAHELWREKAAVAKRSRFEIGNRFAHGSHNAIGKPDPGAGVKSAGKGLADFALAPTTETGVGMRSAEIELIAAQMQLLGKTLGGHFGDFARNDKRVAAQHDTETV